VLLRSARRGVSALVALDDDEFMVLERNNRGVGVDANLAGGDKLVFTIEPRRLRPTSPHRVVDAPRPAVLHGSDQGRRGAGWTWRCPPHWLDPSLAALGGRVARKVGRTDHRPRNWPDGSYLVLAGTDNDYSVTQNASGTQRDVYFKPTVTIDAAGVSTRSVSRIQCDISTFNNCLTVNADGTPGSAVAATFSFSGYRLVPGVRWAQTRQGDEHGSVGFDRRGCGESRQRFDRSEHRKAIGWRPSTGGGYVVVWVNHDGQGEGCCPTAATPPARSACACSMTRASRRDPEVAVNTATRGFQVDPKVAVLANGTSR
jgi:hypothetical protein